LRDFSKSLSYQENGELRLTTEQVAHYLKVDKFTVYRLVSQKKLPAFRVGNQWRFIEEVVLGGR